MYIYSIYIYDFVKAFEFVKLIYTVVHKFN